MMCIACGGAIMYVNGGRQCSQCSRYEPGVSSAGRAQAAAAPAPPVTAQAAAEAVQQVVQIAGKAEELGAKVMEKLSRDARTPVTSPQDVERLGREWMEIVDGVCEVGARARRFFQDLGTTLRGG